MHPSIASPPTAKQSIKCSIFFLCFCSTVPTLRSTLLCFSCALFDRLTIRSSIPLFFYEKYIHTNQYIPTLYISSADIHLLLAPQSLVRFRGQGVVPHSFFLFIHLHLHPIALGIHLPTHPHMYHIAFTASTHSLALAPTRTHSHSFIPTHPLIYSTQLNSLELLTLTHSLMLHTYLPHSLLHSHRRQTRAARGAPLNNLPHSFLCFLFL
ncbi:hypothetical protein B0H14DRAFT_1340232 [Mycena olivaceomarginata]|nr:hypothetical protein B0H14DRAFT_1340232 [Mycena olivaceomarginata]